MREVYQTPECEVFALKPETFVLTSGETRSSSADIESISYEDL